MFDIFKKWKKQELDKFRPENKKRNKKSKPRDNSPKAKLIRKLKHKTRYLEIEYEEAEDLLTKSKVKFYQAIAEYCKENPNAQNPLGPIKKEDKKSEEGNLAQEEIKAIYREIAMATHPDKHPDAGEEVYETFNKATKAKDQNKIDDLINISLDLDIDLSQISMELIEELEKSLSKKEQEIKNMNNDLAVNWSRASEETQNKLIKSICPQKKDKED